MITIIIKIKYDLLQNQTGRTFSILTKKKRKTFFLPLLRSRLGRRRPYRRRTASERSRGEKKREELVEIRCKPGLDHELDLRCVLAARGEETDWVGFAPPPTPHHKLPVVIHPSSFSFYSSRTADVIRSRAPPSGRGRFPLQKSSTPFNFFCTSIIIMIITIKKRRRREEEEAEKWKEKWKEGEEEENEHTHTQKRRLFFSLVFLTLRWRHDDDDDAQNIGQTKAKTSGLVASANRQAETTRVWHIGSRSLTCNSIQSQETQRRRKRKKSQ